MKFLDSTYLDKKPLGMGIGLQNCPLISMHSGETRDSATHAVTAQRWWLEDRLPNDGAFVPAQLDKRFPANFFECLAAAISPSIIPQGGWIILDVEGADSYVADEKRDHAHNLQAFTNLRQLCTSVRVVRPDARIALNVQWHWPKTYNAVAAPPWAGALDCNAMFKSLVLPRIDALSLELYYTDRPAPPAPSAGDDGWGFNDPIWGFRDTVSHACEWAMAITDKPPVILTAMETGWGSRPETTGQFLTGSQMAGVLDLAAKFNPAAIGIWGVAENSPGALNVGGFKFGVFDPALPWFVELAKRAQAANNGG